MRIQPNQLALKSEPTRMPAIFVLWAVGDWRFCSMTMSYLLSTYGGSVSIKSARCIVVARAVQEKYPPDRTTQKSIRQNSVANVCGGVGIERIVP